MRHLAFHGLFVSTSLLIATAAAASKEVRTAPVPPPRAIEPEQLPPADDVDPALRADIVKLMQLTGSAELGHEMAELISEAALQSFKRAHPELPGRAYLVAQDVLKTEYGRGFGDGFLATLIPIYTKHFSHAEIKALIAFYDSEVGRKNVALVPTLVQEYQELGKQWAIEMTPDVQQSLRRRLEVEGFVLN